MKPIEPGKKDAEAAAARAAAAAEAAAVASPAVAHSRIAEALLAVARPPPGVAGWAAEGAGVHRGAASYERALRELPYHLLAARQRGGPCPGRPRWRARRRLW